MHFDLLFEWILNWVKVTSPLGGLGLQQRCLILLMMMHVMQNITVKPICSYIGVVVFSIIIHNIKTIPEVSMHLCKFWAKVTPFYGNAVTAVGLQDSGILLFLPISIFLGNVGFANNNYLHSAPLANMLTMHHCYTMLGEHYLVISSISDHCWVLLCGVL